MLSQIQPDLTVFTIEQPKLKGKIVAFKHLNGHHWSSAKLAP